MTCLAKSDRASLVLAMDSSMVFYAYQGCSTCRAASQWLRVNSIEVLEKPIYTNPPSVNELRRMLELRDGQITKLFNSSGLEYRALGLKTKLPNMSIEEALALLSRNGKLVKRPFLLGPTVGLLGFRQEEWEKTLLT